MSNEFQMFLSSRGITHQTSIPYMPQQNGRAKRFNRTILEKAEAMYYHACLPKAFWQDAVETSVHLYNRQPMRYHDWKAPIEFFKEDGKQPDASYFQVFGCKAYVFIPPKQWPDKLSPKSEEMIFIGYKLNTKGWCFGSKTKHHVMIATNATFDEESFLQCSKGQEDGPASIPIPDNEESDR